MSDAKQWGKISTALHEWVERHENDSGSTRKMERNQIVCDVLMALAQVAHNMEVDEETIIKEGDVLEEGPGIRTVVISPEQAEGERIILDLPPSLEMKAEQYEEINQCPGCIHEEEDGSSCRINVSRNCGDKCPHRAEEMPF